MSADIDNLPSKKKDPKRTDYIGGLLDVDKSMTGLREAIPINCTTPLGRIIHIIGIHGPTFLSSMVQLFSFNQN